MIPAKFEARKLTLYSIEMLLVDVMDDVKELSPKPPCRYVVN